MPEALWTMWSLKVEGKKNIQATARFYRIIVKLVGICLLVHGCIEFAPPSLPFSSSTSTPDFQVQIEQIVLVLDRRFQGPELIVLITFGQSYPPWN